MGYSHMRTMIKCAAVITAVVMTGAGLATAAAADTGTTVIPSTYS